jgi:signal transduction histidine kinase
LRPGVLDELGLVAAIEWQAKEFQSRTGIQCWFTSQHEDVQMAPDQATALFRILQEALTNIARHSQASEVEIRLGADARDLILELKDNGIGFIEGEKPSTQSLGLLGMRERALALRGEVQVRSVAGAGTTVTARIPVADGDPAGAHP